MKCSECGNDYNRYEKACPFCGFQNEHINKKYESKVARFLDREIPNSSLRLTNLNIILIVMVNICILGLIGNAILWFGFDYTFLFCHYIIALNVIIYTILKSFFHEKSKIVRSLKICCYAIIYAFTITQIVEQGVMWANGYVTPIALALMSIITLILYLAGKINNFTFIANILTNIFSMVAPIVLTFFSDYYDFGMCGTILVYASTGLSVLIFVNYLFIKFIELITKIRKRF